MRPKDMPKWDEARPETPDIYQVCSKRAFLGQVTAAVSETAPLHIPSQIGLHHHIMYLEPLLHQQQQAMSVFVMGVQISRWRRLLHAWDPTAGEGAEVITVRLLCHEQCSATQGCACTSLHAVQSRRRQGWGNPGSLPHQARK